MIFQYTWENILAGEKSQTRRIVKTSEIAEYDENGNVITVRQNGRKKWAVGQTYSVQPGRTKPEIARIRITEIRQEPVTDITDEDGIAEGYASAAEFLQGWENIHGADKFDTNVWVLGFEVIETNSTTSDE